MAQIPTTGLTLWLEANVGVTSSGGNVSAWTDQSGNGNNATQSNSGNQPTVDATALNGLPAIAFAASGAQFMFLPSLSGATAGEVFIVVKATSATPSGVRGLWHFGSGCSYPDTNGNIYDGFASSSTYTVGLVPPDITQFNIYNVSSQSGQWTAQVDGVMILNSTSNSVSFGGTTLLGDSGSQVFDGEIAEVVVYNRVLTASERLTVDQYLDSKYALPGISVPSNPTGLVATPLSATEVSLVWSDSATTTGITYTVWRKTGSGSYASVAQVNNTLEFVDSGLSAGTTYSYEISSATFAGSSPGYSTAANATTFASGTDMPLTGMNLWLVADGGVLATSSGSVIQWLDQSGNGNNAIQLTSSDEPTVVSSALNGRPAVAFVSSSNQFFSLPNSLMSGVTAAEIFVVVKATSASPSSDRGMARIGNNATVYPNASGNIGDGFASTTAYVSAPPPSGITQYSIYDVSSQSGQWIACLDGVTLLNSTSNSVSFSSSPQLGGGDNTFDGEIAEVIIYSSVLSAAQRATVDQYLDSKYALPGISTPSNPTGLAVTPISATETSLVWSDTATTTGITYTIWRETGSGGYTAIAQVSNALSYVDSGLTAGTSYSYKISSTTFAGSSPGYSTAVSATTLSSGTDMPLTGMNLWLVADSGVQATSGGSVIQWLDRSGNANNAIQLTSADEPTVVSSALNGRPVVAFASSSNQFFALPNSLMSGASAAEMFVVVKATSASPSSDRGMARIGNNATVYPNSSGNLGDGFASTTAYVSAPPPSGITQYSIYDVSSQSGQWIARLDGVTLLNSTSNSVSFSSSPQLGGGDNTFDGEIAEVIIYSSVLSAAQRATVDQYLDSKYALPGISAPSNPTGLAVTPISATEASLVWSDSATTTGITYTIWRETGSGGYTAVAEVNNALSYVDSGLTAGTSYSYKISSSNFAGSSPGYSAAVSTTTFASGTDMPLTGMNLWLVADSGVQATSGGSVIQWLDQSGNGNNAIQLTSADEPTLVSSAINGRPVVAFASSSNQFFSLPNALMSGASAAEMFVVVKATSASPSSDRGMARIGNNATVYPNSSGNVDDGFASGTAYNEGPTPMGITQYSVYDVSGQSGLWTARLDGITLLNSTSNSVGFSSSPQLGGGDNTFDGEIAEVIIYSSVLSDSQRTTVDEYLESKYALPGISVPSNPTGLIAAPVSATEVSLVWSDAPTTTGIIYTIWRKTGSGSYTAVAQTNNALSYVDSALTAGTSYSYEISSRTMAGPSPGYSTAATVSTPASGTDMPLTGMNLWLIADSGVQATSGGSVIQWLDQSGNGNNAVQLTTSKEPTSVPFALNGRPSVAFAASSVQYFNLPNLMSGATEGEAFVVVKATSVAPSNSRAVMLLGNNPLLYPDTAGNVYDGFGSYTNYEMNASASDLVHYSLYNVSAQSGQWTARDDGVVLVNSTSNSVTFASSPQLGASGGGSAFDGEIVEVIIYNSVLTDAQRAAVVDYFGNKYLPVLLLPNFNFGLQANAISTSEVDLSWVGAPTAASYIIQRSVDGGSWLQIATVSAPTTTYADTSLPTGNVINYEIQGVDSAGSSSAFSAAVSAFPHPGSTDPNDDIFFSIDQMLGIDPASGDDAFPVAPVTPTPTPTPTESSSITTPPTVILVSPSQATLH